MRRIFEQWGRPYKMRFDNGVPWATTTKVPSALALWLVGLDIQPDWISYSPNILESASLATAKLMQAQNPPTAVICTNDVMAFGAKIYFDEIGMQLGRDIALTGYDDDPTSAFLKITSVQQPIDLVAETAFDILLGEIKGTPREERQVVFDPVLVPRQSTLG